MENIYVLYADKAANKMKKVLLTSKYTDMPLQLLLDSARGKFEVIVLDKINQQQLEAHIPEADYLLVSGRQPITKELLKKANNLKMIQRTGVGLDSLDLGYIKDSGIPLYVNQGVNSQSVAEHALLLILASLRNITNADKNTKQGIWNKQSFGITTHELHGKFIGLIGMGNIAKKLAKMLSGFEVKIGYYDIKRLPVCEEKELNLQYCKLDFLLKVSDIISLHCPLTNETKHIIDKTAISKMKTGSILINTARGELINTNDLIEALESNKISFAALDVHEEEPLPKDSPIVNLENVILTPHIGGVTYEAFSKMINDAIRNIELFEKGQFEEIEPFLYRF